MQLISSPAARTTPRPFGIYRQDPYEAVLLLVAKERNVPRQLLKHESRCHVETARARQLAMYLTHVIMRQSMTAVGEFYGRDRTTVSYACGVIEDMRDDPHFDAEVSRLESILESGRGNND